MLNQVGRYQIEAAIGSGAMADVYRAQDPEIGRAIAIKILKSDLRRDPDVVRRFLRESRAAGALSHANIATIYDVGEYEGIPYIAMEHIEGRTLEDVLAAQGRMVGERVIEIAIQLASALAYAHGQGVVHRDIKPSNIMLRDAGGSATILDFGIAHVLDGDDQQLGRTQAGQVIGTPRYMSPEQALGMPTDHRSDLFSLGVVLYEMVTGKPAFSGSGLATVALQVAQKDPEPIARLVRDCPKGLRFLIEKLIAKKPARRFADAGQVLATLQREANAQSDASTGHRSGLTLGLKLPLLLGLTTAIVLALSVATVLDRQTRTLEAMALTTGSATTAFVASNAALHTAENMDLSPAEQDWLPLQAFAQSAAENPDIKGLVIVDDRNVVRAASNRALVGTRYGGARGEPAIVFKGQDKVTLSRSAGHEAFRFVRPILYAGVTVGKVDMLLSREPLDAAMASARWWLIALSIAVTLAVLLMAAAVARSITHPIRRLRAAFDEVAAGGSAFRLSHRRGGDIGTLFDSFNAMLAAIDDRLAARPGARPEEEDMTRTRISAVDPAQQSNPRKAA